MFLPIGLALWGFVAVAADWPRFRGPAGSGIAPDSESVPSEWSPTTNIAWKIPLPGPGASSPIIVGNKVLVTCYSGYDVDRDHPGEIENLVRNLVRIDLRTGDKLWQKNVPGWLPEDSYDKSGVSSHGYASHTPVSDGVNVYCFFGKGGVHAFNLKGDELWNAEAGKESDPPRWGSSSRPVIHENTLIVTASAESQSIIGFDKETGEKRWQQFASGLDGMWGTPTLVQVDENRTDLVMLVAQELWGLDPRSGRLRWFGTC
jgi:outer membrane protein assembly factor BamB